MRRRARIILGFALPVAAIAGALLCQSARGPVYAGSRTADWVNRALRNTEDFKASAAVLKIGSPAVPFIVSHGLRDRCHRFRFLSSDRVLAFTTAHPRLDRWLRLSDRTDNCAGKHGRACRLLSRMGTNAQAAVPAVIDRLEHCPSLHVEDAHDLLDTLADISGTNLAAIPYLTRRARDNDSPCLRAAVTAYYIDDQTNLLVETCHRLAQVDLSQLLGGHELYWLREDHRLNEHLVPLLEALYADPRLSAGQRESILFELESHGEDAAAIIAHLRAGAHLSFLRDCCRLHLKNP